MMLRSKNRIALIVVLVAALTGLVVRSGSAPTIDSTDPAAQLLRTTERAKIVDSVVARQPVTRDQTVRLAIEAEVLAGMHVNANPPTHEWLIPVEVSVEGVEGVSVVEGFYPEAISRKFPYDEEPYLVYEGRFVVGLLLGVSQSAPAGAHELTVVLDYQACNDEACFAPAQHRLKVPFAIAESAALTVEVSSPLLDRAPFPKH